MKNLTSMKLGGISFISGLFLFILTSFQHPYENDPADSYLAFIEYAQSENWVMIHTLQFISLFILSLGFISLYYQIKEDTQSKSPVALFGLMSVVASITVLAVLQATDGVALKFIIDRWKESDFDQSLFTIAETVRWLEIGLNGFYRILLGTTFLFFGIVIIRSSVFHQWKGWLAIAGGLFSIWNGFEVNIYGFARETYYVGGIASLLTILWYIVTGISMIRSKKMCHLKHSHTN